MGHVGRPTMTAPIRTPDTLGHIAQSLGLVDAQPI